MGLLWFGKTLKTAVSRGHTVAWQCLSPYWCPHCCSSVVDVLQDCAMTEVVSLHPIAMEAWVQSHLVFVPQGQVFLWVYYATLVGLVVSMLASGTWVCGFKPGRSRQIFSGVKILSMPSFGREVKLFAPCRRSCDCMGVGSQGKICQPFFLAQAFLLR
jgi:hypothetical protein